MSADDPEEWPLGRLLSTAARMVERDWNHRLATHELTHAGLLALHALRDGPLTQRELAAASRVEEQTMSRVLERLERNGHVTRQRDTTDRRRLVIRRTSAGGELSDDLTRAGYADQLVAERVADPSAFRAELVRLVDASPSSGPPSLDRPSSVDRPITVGGPSDTAGDDAHTRGRDPS